MDDETRAHLLELRASQAEMRHSLAELRLMITTQLDRLARAVEELRQGDERG